MCRYNIVPRILLILIAIKFALAAPVLVQEKRRAPEDVITVLERRSREQDLNMLWDGLRLHDRVWGNRPQGQPGGGYLQELAEPQHGPPPNAAEAHVQVEPVPPPGAAGVHEQGIPVPPPPNAAGAHAQWGAMPPPNLAGVHAPPQGAANPNIEMMELDSEAPPPSPTSEHSDSSPPPSPKRLKMSTPSDSERRSTNSNAPSEEYQSENPKTADHELKGKAKVSRHISGNASGIDTDAAQMELRGVIDPAGP